MGRRQPARAGNSIGAAFALALLGASGAARADGDAQAHAVADDASTPEAAIAAEGGSGWVLTFHDEFDGTSIDPCKWQLRQKWGEKVVNHELEAYVSTENQDQAFSFDNGVLHIVARRQKGIYGGQALPYTSGLIASVHNQRYGYFETRSRMPTGSGMWPAFWLLHTPGFPDIHEIDITEWINTSPATVLMTNHFGTNYDTNSLQAQFMFFAGDLTSAFHVFGLDWEPDRIIWYADGVEVGRVTAPYQMHDVDMYVVANLAVGGDLPGSPTPGAVFPASYDLDYIRVFQRGVGNATGLPPFGPELTVANDESVDAAACGVDSGGDAADEVQDASADVDGGPLESEAGGDDVDATSSSATTDAGATDASPATTLGSLGGGCAAASGPHGGLARPALLAALGIVLGRRARPGARQRRRAR